MWIIFQKKQKKMLSSNIHGQLGKIEIGADACCGGDPGSMLDFLHQLFGQLSGCHAVMGKIRGHVHKHFINGIHHNVFWSNVF